MTERNLHLGDAESGPTDRFGSKARSSGMEHPKGEHMILAVLLLLLVTDVLILVHELGHLIAVSDPRFSVSESARPDTSSRSFR